MTETKPPPPSKPEPLPIEGFTTPVPMEVAVAVPLVESGPISVPTSTPASQAARPAEQIAAELTARVPPEPPKKKTGIQAAVAEAAERRRALREGRLPPDESRAAPRPQPLARPSVRSTLKPMVDATAARPAANVNVEDLFAKAFVEATGGSAPSRTRDDPFSQ